MLSDPSLCTPWLVLLLLPKMQDFTFVLREGSAVQREAAGSGQSCGLSRSSWTRSLLASAGVGAGFCTWWNLCQLWAVLEWHYPASFISMEMCKKLCRWRYAKERDK